MRHVNATNHNKNTFFNVPSQHFKKNNFQKLPTEESQTLNATSVNSASKHYVKVTKTDSAESDFSGIASLLETMQQQFSQFSQTIQSIFKSIALAVQGFVGGGSNDTGFNPDNTGNNTSDTGFNPDNNWDNTDDTGFNPDAGSDAGNIVQPGSDVNTDNSSNTDNNTNTSNTDNNDSNTPSQTTDGNYNVYFGQLHQHTDNSDGDGDVNEAFDAGDKHLDFMAVTDHATQVNSSEWKETKEEAKKATDDDFVGLAGFEISKTDHMNVFGTDWIGDGYKNISETLDKIASDPNAVAQFNHPDRYGSDAFNDFKYNEAADKNVTMMEIGNKGDISSKHMEHFIEALDKGWHIAPTIGEDNHKAKWGESSYKTAILAKDLTQNSLLDAMRNRRVYATDDKNLEIDFNINGHGMGSIIDKSGQMNMSVRTKDGNGEHIEKMELVTKGGKVVASHQGADDWNFKLDASNPYYFVRIHQKDGDQAVTAPIWIEGSSGNTGGGNGNGNTGSVDNSNNGNTGSVDNSSNNSSGDGWTSLGSKLSAGQTMKPNQYLESSNKQYRLYFQDDGNLVLRNQQKEVLWSTGTHGKGGTRLTMQGDGNLVIYNNSNKAVWSSKTHGTDASKLVLKDYGTLKLEENDGKDVWLSTKDGSAPPQPGPTPPNPNSGPPPLQSGLNGSIETRWGGQPVNMWAITKDNDHQSGIGDSATCFLVTVNDTSISGMESLAKQKGFEVISKKGKSDAGVLFMRPKSGNQDFEALLNFGKVTITAVKEPSGKRLTPDGSGGFETRPTGGMGFGTTDNTNTKGEFFKTDGANSKIIKNNEDDGYVWHKGSDIKNFRGGWMSLNWR